MKQLIAALWNGEPVAVLSALATLVPLFTGGLVVFGVWVPDAEQLAYVNGAVGVVAGAFGITVTRNKVTPSPTQEEPSE